MSVFVTRRGEKNELNEYNLEIVKTTDNAISAAAFDTGMMYGTSATLEDCAIFVGGASGRTGMKHGKIYTPSLTVTQSTAALSTGRSYLAGAVAGKNAIFAGGVVSSAKVNIVDALDLSFTRKTPSEHLSIERSGLAGASIGDFAIFVGGIYNNSSFSSAIDVYDSSLTRTILENSTLGGYIQAASTPTHAIFGTFNSDICDAFDNNLTKTTITAMRETKINAVISSVGEYAIFAGGKTVNGTSTNTVDAVDASLTRKNATNLQQVKYGAYQGATENFCLIIEGYTSSGYSTFTVDAYDKSLTRTIQQTVTPPTESPPQLTYKFARAGANLIGWMHSTIYKEVAVKQY